MRQSVFSYTGIPENTLEELTTDSSGQSETIELDAPPVEYSWMQQMKNSHMRNIPWK